MSEKFIAPASLVKSVSAAAADIIRAFKGHNAAVGKFNAKVSLAGQGVVDAAIVAGVPKTEQGVKALQQAFTKSEAMEAAVEAGLLERKTVTEYAQSLARAFYHGVPFTPALKNDKALGLPWGKASGATAKTAGAVKTTDRAALDATLCKALEQARMLGLTEFAAVLLDHCFEALDGFKETEAAPM